MTLKADTTVLEGSYARYAVYLDGDLAQGVKVTFTIKVGGTATVGDDYLQLLGASLDPAPGVTITFTTNPGDGSIVVTAEYAPGTAIPGPPLPGPGNPGFPVLGAQLLSFEILTIEDELTEIGEKISVAISNSSIPSIVSNTFSDIDSIIVDGPLQIKLIGDSSVAEGGTASYKVVLDDGVALGANQSFSFSLDTAGLTATEGTDFARLIASGITTATGFSLVSDPVIDPETNRIKLTVINNTGAAINEFREVVRFSIDAFSTNAGSIILDTAVEGNETFSVTLSNPTGTTLGPSVVTTTINDDDRTPQIKLIGDSSVAEGGTASYKVVLDDGVALANGQSFEFSLDSAGLTATEGTDFAQLLASGITTATGFSFVGTPVIDPATGRIKLTVRNTSGAVINQFQDVVNISIASTQDLLVEGTETFSLTLANPTGTTLGTSVVTTSINDDDAPLIRLIGETSTAEGAAASYAVVLDGTALATGRSFSFSLDTAGIGATEDTDFAALIASGITAASGITLSAISTDPVTKKVSLTATNTSGAALDAGRQIVTFSINTTQDLLAEGNETFSVTLADPAGVTVGTSVIATTISDDDVTLKIRLDAESLVAEGGSANYLVSLDGVVLRAGENVRFRLDTASGTNLATRATEVADFAALVAANLQAVDGITLSAISTAANGAVTLTATNTSGFDLPDDTLLLRFKINTNDDIFVEGTEDFTVALTSTSATVTAGTDSRTTSITDNDTAAIKLTGATTVAEGGSASYAVSLDGVGLRAGQRITFTLDSSGLTATQGAAFDFAELLVSNAGAGLSPAPGITFSSISTDATTGAVTLTATNSGASDLAVGAQLLSFSLATTSDPLPEINETFSVSLSSSSATVTAGSVSTTITDDDAATIELTGASSVTEGGPASYDVSLDGVGLGVGRSVTFTLDSQGLGDATGLSAKEGVDFAALLASALTPGTGFSITTSAGSNGALVITATNTGANDRPVDSQLLSFSLATTADLISEANETFSVSLASSSATVSTGVVTTTITDNDSLAVRIIGPTTVEEGAATAAYTVSLGSAVGLGGGRSVQFSLDSASGTATEGIDYSALVASSLRAAAGITLSTNAGAGGLFNITATRTGSSDLEAGADLLSFAINTTPDNTNEAAETFTVTLAGAAGATVEGSAVVSTSISEDTGPFRRVLNYGRSVGNVTIQPGGFVAAPLTAEEGFAQDGLSYPADVPKELVGGFDYGLYFEYFREVTLSDNGNVTAVSGKFNTDQSTGLKVSRDGLIRYSPDSGQNDNLVAIGYTEGSLTSGVYINALELTTIRMGAGNDSFSLTGEGITQKLSAEVSKEESAGYIFQSSIFAEAGDDTVSVLMPFQSRFSGGTNTPYRDAIFDPSGTGTPITLSASLTVEEISQGDLIELKGSRYDWDIEFKDGPDAGTGVSLASILDDSSGDYLAISNNNQVSGFERIRFGDILFDLILARQQDSADVFGQPDYNLIGAEKEAPELNSDINQNSQLWEAFRFNRTKLQGIVGTATDSVDVFTGDARDTPYLVGALRFASLNTEGGDDIAVIGSGEQAAVNLGSGSDQLEVKGAFTRSSVDGGDGNDGIILATVSNATVITGDGDDIVSVLTEVSSTILNGGAGTADQLLLPTTFAASALTSTVSAGAVNFSDAFGNSITGFETFKFSDITLDALETLTLTGPAAPTKIEEGSSAAYDIGLASALNGGNGLQTGQSVEFTLKISNGTDANPANVSADLGAITADLLTAAPGLVLRSVNVDVGNGLIRVLASAATTIAAGSRIATLTLPVIADLLAETDESFGVSLKDFVQTVAITSTISNVAPATIRLVDISPTAGTALEGASASYAIELDGVGLVAGRAVTITLDSSSGTATETVDFPALVAGRLTAAIGVTLGTPTVDPTTGAVTITATNSGATALPAGARLLTFQLPISVDTNIEGDETFNVSLTSTTAAVSSGFITTTIRDLVPTPIISLSGQSSVIEGLTAAYAVSLSSGGLLPGQSFSLTLAATSGTATDVTDFVAFLLDKELTAGEGITLGKVSVDPATKAASLTVTNSSQKSLAVGAQLLSFIVATIPDSAAEANETYNINLSSSTATVTTETVTTTITDFAPSTQPPAGALLSTSVLLTVGDSSESITSTLSQLTSAVPLKAESRRLLDSYKVNDPISGTSKQASAGDTMYIDFTVKTGAFKSITAEIALDKEVKANAYVKVNPNTGEAFDFTYDPITGLGAQLLDNNKNGLVDTLKIFLQDGGKGDIDGLVNGEIRDPGVLADAPRQSVYRFFKASKGVHFYTSSDAERAIVNANPEWGYKDEGVAYDALVTQGKAVHRFFNAKASYHFMTTNNEEAKTIKANPGWGYSYEGQSFNVSTTPQLGMSTPVNRFYRVLDGVGQHFYTASADEASNIISNPEWGYKLEGVGWYV